MATSTNRSGDNEIVCAITESRGISSSVGLSFVNLTTSEAVLCQFTDTQTYARTCHKLRVFSPTEIIYSNTHAESNLVSILRENLDVENADILMNDIDRKYWSEGVGFDYVQQLAFPNDLESLNVSIGGNYFATCCFGAVMRYVELSLCKTFAPQTLRIRFESSEGSMMLDLATISSLELIQNLQDANSKASLFGVLDETMTKMGARTLRSNILQPSTDAAKITQRHEALEELVLKEEVFIATRTALQAFVDTDRCLSALVILPTKFDFAYMEQSVNDVLMLKSFVDSIKSVWQALSGVTREELVKIRELCAPGNYAEVQALIKYAVNDDVTYAHQGTELRNQRVYAINAGVNGFLDVARQTYKEINEDVSNMVRELNDTHQSELTLKFDPARQFYFQVPASQFEDKPLPEDLINVIRNRKMIECQTLELVKMNQKIKDAHNEVINMSDMSIQELIGNIRSRIHPLFKISEAIALLDMLCSFAQLTTAQNYTKPELTSTLAIKAGRHPIREKVQHDRFIPNDVYATREQRFQIITGCNMAGKSTYIRSIALMSLMAQLGCFVPAAYASFPIFHQLFTRVSTDSSIEANVSTFASEMRDMAHILRNIEPRSLVIVDELGRGTSTADGLAIAIAIAEALVESGAFVWFVTHFQDLPRILEERTGVVNRHLAVDFVDDKMKMTFKLSDGPVDMKHYGLMLARAIDLPRDVIEVATHVSAALTERTEARKANPGALAVIRRRKLILGMHEHLQQAVESDGTSNEALSVWLKRLQDEFIVKMNAIQAEAGTGDYDQS